MAITRETTTAAQTAAQRIREINASLMETLQAALTEVYRTFWANAQGATPQEIADAMGEDAYSGFCAHAALVATVVAVCQHDGLPINVPTAIPPAWSYKVDDNRQMHLTYTPPPEPAPQPPENPEG